MDWHKCRFLESSDNLKPLVKRRFGREPSTNTAREIIACLQQGRLFYETAEKSPLEIKPLQLFYGMVGFAKALVIANRLCSVSTLKPSHGITDISEPNSRIADLQVKIGSNGTFQEFNNVVAQLSRVCYFGDFLGYCSESLPSATSEELTGLRLSLRDILSRVHEIEPLYRLTFSEESNTELLDISSQWPHGSNEAFTLSLDDPRPFTDRYSLKQIIDDKRRRFPFLKNWRLVSAQRAWSRTTISLSNIDGNSIDEFSEQYGVCANGTFQTPTFSDIKFSSLKDSLSPMGGFSTNQPIAISPIVQNLYLSEFSYHYLGLFLLSSLVRYRPQIWANVIVQSYIEGQSRDDKALSLIERFLDVNFRTIPEMVVKTLNPHEDSFFNNN